MLAAMRPMTIRHDLEAARSDRVDDVASLHAHRPGPIDVARCEAVLGDGHWLGEGGDAGAAPTGTTRFVTDLQLPLPPDGRVLRLRKAAFVDIGPIVRAGGGFDVEIAWRSATLAPMFPVFAGRLCVRTSGLTIEGHYAPPGGALGRAADRMLLHTAAGATARWFLAHLADQT